MSLSICLITADPPSRVAAAVEPLQALADEVMIAADSRVGDETLAGYNAIADKLFRIEFRFPERHLAWLYAQCNCDWILRLDGDEMPSQAFVRRLPEMLASRKVQQFWIPRAWLYPDAEHVLAEAPWSEDFVNRLTRNDGTLRISGKLHTHAEPVGPCEYVEEPFYHLDLLTSNHHQRRDKAVRYEVALPRLRAAGGGRINEAFYVPELREALELSPVPDEDQSAIERALIGSSTPISAPPNGSVPFVSLQESDRMWESRDVRADAYRANIALRAATLSMTPSEQRHVLVRVRNEGGERWPASLTERPLIRLSYRWLNADGSVLTPEGPRSAFPRPVDPGETTLAPLHVDAPTTEGRYLLEVDVVHEGVRWFDCACRVPVKVERLRSLPPTGPRLRETRPARGNSQGLRIPRMIHRVWIGETPMPAEHEHYGKTFAKHHPDWGIKLWTEENLEELGIGASERARCRTHSELANLMRYEVLRRYGGVYVDTDVECLKPLTQLLGGVEAFAALEVPERIGNAILGSVPNHPAFERATRLARQTLGIGAHSADANGPYFLTLIFEQEQDVEIFGAELFYPYLWDEPKRRHEKFSDAYAVHHWARSWVDNYQPG